MGELSVEKDKCYVSMGASHVPCLEKWSGCHPPMFVKHSQCQLI